jgi:hypothetical protein
MAGKSPTASPPRTRPPRVIKKPQRYGAEDVQQARPEETPTPSDSLQQRKNHFLKCLYKAIHVASIDSAANHYTSDAPPNQAHEARIEDLKLKIRHVRTRRFWLHASEGQRHEYNTSEARYVRCRTAYPYEDCTSARSNPTKAGRYAKLDGVVESFKADIANEQNDNMQQEIVGRCGYVLLSTCLFANFLRLYLFGGPDEHSYLSWDEKLQAIEDHRSSLELFAKVRSLPIQEAQTYKAEAESC